MKKLRPQIQQIRQLDNFFGTTKQGDEVRRRRLKYQRESMTASQKEWYDILTDNGEIDWYYPEG